MPQLTRLLKNSALFRSFERAKGVHPYPVKFTKANARDLSRGIYIPEADAFLTGESAANFILLEDLGAVARVKQDLHGEFEFADGRWIVKFDGLSFALVNKADPWLLCEIFLDGVYNISSNDQPSVALDIGMNCGVASLYLAHRYGCPVHGFELCSPTFEAAESNMSLNPNLAGRIHRHCFGLADKNENLEISYQGAKTVVASLYDLEATDKDRKLPVEVRRASEELGPILEEANGPVFAKMDCEGAEFAIMRDLDRAGLMKKIGAIVMEWHSQAGDPNEIVEILVRNGFTVFNQNWVEGLGFLRAAQA
jgi:FkbM family methyltransferase